jgi:hypothetical protein
MSTPLTTKQRPARLRGLRGSQNPDIINQVQGSQPPPRDFDQLVEGPRSISTSCPPGGLCGGASAFWREIWSKHPLFRAQMFDQLVEDLSRISENRGLRPLGFDPWMRLRALIRCKGSDEFKRLSLIMHLASVRQAIELYRLQVKAFDKGVLAVCASM